MEILEIKTSGDIREKKNWDWKRKMWHEIPPIYNIKLVEKQKFPFLAKVQHLENLS